MIKASKLSTFIGILSVAATAPALAEFSGEGNLGFSAVSGNSDSESLSAKLAAEYASGNWTHAASASAYAASSDDEQTAESYSAKLETDYLFSEKTYWLGSAAYKSDRFSAYDNQATVSLGVGHHLIDNGITTLDLEGGVGYRSSEPSDNSDTENETIFVGGVTFNHTLTDTTSFSSSWSVESGSENTYAEADLGLRVAMSEALGLALGYVVKHNTEVSEGTEKTDRYTSVTLSYLF